MRSAIEEPAFQGPLEPLARLFDWMGPQHPSPVDRKSTFKLLLEEYAAPLDRFMLVKVAGTNGKGSVAVMLDACLRAAGKRVGLFTSPHLERVNERIRIDGREISDEELAGCVADLRGFFAAFLRKHGPGHTLPFFHAIALLALHAFRKRGVDVVVMEAGVGGFTDIVSLLPDVLSVVTSVSMDHEDRLGRSLLEIALNKAMIASDGSHLVLGPGISVDLADAMEALVRPKGVRVTRSDPRSVRASGSSPAGTRVGISTREGWVEAALPLLGGFQLLNLASVAAAVGCLAARGIVGSESCLRGIESVRWPGRFERLAGLDMLLDVAHNEEGIRALADGLRQGYADRRRILLFGASRGKQYERYLPLLPEIASKVFVTDDFHLAEDRETLAGKIALWVEAQGRSSSVGDLLAGELSPARRDGAMLVVAGSVFLVGRVRAILRKRDLLSD